MIIIIMTFNRPCQLQMSIAELQEMCRKLIKFQIHAYQLKEAQLFSIKDFVHLTGLAASQKTLVLGRIKLWISPYQLAELKLKNERLRQQIDFLELQRRKNRQNENDKIIAKSQPAKHLNKHSKTATTSWISKFSTKCGQFFGLSQQNPSEKVQQLEEKQPLLNQNANGSKFSKQITHFKSQ